MKKFLPYILTLLVVVNLFAPFSVIWKENNTLSVTKNEAKASGIIVLGGAGQITSTDTTISVTVTAEFPTDFSKIDSEGVSVYLKKPTESEEDAKLETLTDNFKVVADKKNTKSGTVVFQDLTPNTQYQVWYAVLQDEGSVWGKLTSGWRYGYDNTISAEVRNPSQNYYEVTTTSGGQANVNTETSGNAEGMMPACGVSTGDELLGCVAKLFYYAVFTTTSFLFGLAGKFFDWTFAYSITDTSYRTAFVNEGWAIVRDICNIFFIFVLLYAAFKSIFGSHEAKSIVINVIIIGLLINFSLFAARIMIDASNILARLFYTSQAVEILASDSSGNYSRGGVDTLQDSGLGELSLSSALVNKINPQKIILGARNINIKDDALGANGNAQNNKNQPIGIGAFFLITLLAVIVNVVGLFVFLSVGLIFVARVIGLWIAMVLAPFAFFSYTVPKLSKTKMLGWSNWWSDTLGLCFVAPIFMFFLYLILLFLENGFSSLIDPNVTGANFVLVTIIPFVFIMILLMTAKKLAKEYSGTIGQTITGAVTAVGAAALGGAALGTAWAGRGVGKGFNMASQQGTRLKEIKEQKAAGTYVKQKGDWKAQTFGRIGNPLNRTQEKINKVDHARHELDTLTEKKFGKGQRFERLSGYQKSLIQQEHAKKERAGVEEKYRRENGLSKSQALTAAQRSDVDAKLSHEFDHFVDEAKKKISGLSRAFSQVNTGSWDVRNMSDVKQDRREGLITKFSSKLMSGTAGGMRMGLNKSADINYGKGFADIFKDLGHTITEALKSAKFEIKADASHGAGAAESGHDAGHGGGH